MTASKRRTVWVFLAVTLVAAMTVACSAEAKINVGNSSNTGAGTGGSSNPANEVIVMVTVTPAPFQLTQAAADATFSADQIIAAKTLIPLQQTQAADMVRGTQVAVSVQATATAYPLQETQMAAAVIARDLTATTVALVDRKQAETLQGETGLMLGFSGGSAFFLLAVAVAINMAQYARRDQDRAATQRIERERQEYVQREYMNGQGRADERLAEARRLAAERAAAAFQVPNDQQAAAVEVARELLSSARNRHDGSEGHTGAQSAPDHNGHNNNRQAHPHADPGDKADGSCRNGKTGPVEDKYDGY